MHGGRPFLPKRQPPSLHEPVDGRDHDEGQHGQPSSGARWNIDGGTWMPFSESSCTSCGTTPTPVLILGAGYDAAADDDATSATARTMGRGVYVLNAVTGAVLWSAGSTGMTKTVAKELGKYGIRVNSIHPGAIVTDMIDHMLGGGRDEKMIKRQPIKRLGTPHDIAEMALFLASDRSGYCTGQQFTVDGGVHG